MDLGEVGWGDVDWIGLAKDRERCRALVNAVMNLRVSKCWNVPEWLHNWRPLEKESAACSWFQLHDA
jgi:hypothetical protein